MEVPTLRLLVTAGFMLATSSSLTVVVRRHLDRQLNEWPLLVVPKPKDKKGQQPTAKEQQ